MCALLAGAIVLAGPFRLVALASLWVSMQGSAVARQATGVGLSNYRVSIEGRVIAGAASNVSGLTYSTSTSTLFSVINSPPQIIELSTDGRLLRRIALEGVHDPEGITHVRDDIFVVIAERERQLYLVRIQTGTDRLEVHALPRLALPAGTRPNRGLEGVSWDSTHERLFIAQEKSPLRVWTITGLLPRLDGRTFDLQISEHESSSSAAWLLSDISSLHYHEATGHLLLLSDESALIIEYALDGKPVSMLPMWWGWHGLSRRVPQAEGIALGPEGALYVVSEPNLFYRFERQPAPTWATAFTP